MDWLEKTYNSKLRKINKNEFNKIFLKKKKFVIVQSQTRLKLFKLKETSSRKFSLVYHHSCEQKRECIIWHWKHITYKFRMDGLGWDGRTNYPNPLGKMPLLKDPLFCTWEMEHSNNFLKWLKDSDAFVSPKIAIKDYTEEGARLGVVALDDIKVKSTITKGHVS